MNSNFYSGLKKVGLGIGIISTAPIIVFGAASIVATVGAGAIVGGLTTEVSVMATGLTAMEVAEKSVVMGGTLIAAKGAKEMAE